MFKIVFWNEMYFRSWAQNTYCGSFVFLHKNKEKGKWFLQLPLKLNKEGILWNKHHKWKTLLKLWSDQTVNFNDYSCFIIRIEDSVFVYYTGVVKSTWGRLFHQIRPRSSTEGIVCPDECIQISSPSFRVGFLLLVEYIVHSQDIWHSVEYFLPVEL